jgi:hypothetical protein
MNDSFARVPELIPAPPVPGNRPWIEGKGLKWIMLGGTLVLLFLAWAFGSVMYRNYKLALQGVGTFHNELDHAQYPQIYATATDNFRRAAAEPQTTKFLEMVHNNMGNVEAVHVLGFHFNKVNGITWATMSCRTQFALGEAQENFTLRIEDGQPKLVGYRINSPRVH